MTEAKPRSLWRGKYEASISEAEENKRLVPEEEFIYAFLAGFSFLFSWPHALTQGQCKYIHHVHAVTQ